MSFPSTPASPLPGDYCLLDTNCLLRWVLRRDPQHPQVRRAVQTLHTGRINLCFMLQSEIEAWNALTRPTERNGYGYTPAQAGKRLQLCERVFPRLPETDAVHAEWRRLVQAYSVSGVQVHDARIAAMLCVYKVPYILTYNGSDFARYAPEGITAMDPSVY